MPRLFRMIVLFIFSLNGLTITAQQTADAKIVYYCNSELIHSEFTNGSNTLYFNSHYSNFIHDDYPAENSMTEHVNTVKKVVGDEEKLPVFINQKDSVIYCKVPGVLLGYSLHIVEEPLVAIEWEITNKTKKIADFTCISATGTYGGRTYDVWFSPQIPAKVGPYKLWGLPGAILEAKSQDGKISYEFQSYSPQLPVTYQLEKPANGEKLTLTQLGKAKVNLKYKKESQSNDLFTITISDARPNTYVELDRYNFIEQYEANRK